MTLSFVLSIAALAMLKVNRRSAAEGGGGSRGHYSSRGGGGIWGHYGSSGVGV